MKTILQGFFVLFILILQSIQGQGQQQVPLSNFMNNQLIYNPASAGMHDAQFNLSTVARTQWSTFEGAPIGGMLWTDYRSKSNKMAVGVNVGTLSYSGYTNTDLNINYAYLVPLTNSLKLSMGLRGGINSLSFSTDKLQIFDQDDQVISTSGFNSTTPKFGLGFQLNAKKAYIGIASGDFIATKKIDLIGDTATSFLNRKRNYTLLAGAVLRLNDLYNLRPAIGVFYYPGTNVIAKLNTTFEIKDYFSAGLTYSSNNFAAINLMTNISSRIRFGYAYETFIGELGLGLNSHELNLLITLDNLFRKK